jgi:hypothetical protein
MAKFLSDGTRILIGKVGAQTPAEVAITGVEVEPAAGNVPARVKVTGANTLVKGDYAVLKDIGAPTIEGKLLRVDEATATEFYVVTDVASVTLGTAAKFIPYTTGATEAADLVLSCMVNMTLQTQDAPSVDTSDLCGAGAILGTSPPPSFSFAAWVDTELPGFKNLIQAALTVPKPILPTVLEFPGNNGYIAGPAQIGSISTGVTTGAAVQVTGNGAFTEQPLFSWIV